MAKKKESELSRVMPPSTSASTVISPSELSDSELSDVWPLSTRTATAVPPSDMMTPTPPAAKDLSDEMPGQPVSTSENQKTRVVRHQQAFCPFCNKWVNQFSRHLDRHHPLTNNVQKMTGHPQQRRKVLLQLRYRGLRIYNEMKTADEPLGCPKSTIVGERIPCAYCKVPLLKSSMKKHAIACPERPFSSQGEFRDFMDHQFSKRTP